MKSPINKNQLLAVLVLLLVFTTDLFMPHHVSAASLYLFGIVCIMRESIKTILIFTFSIVFLVALEFVLNFRPDLDWMIYADTIISTVITGLVAFMAIRHRTFYEKSNHQISSHLHSIKKKDSELTETRELYRRTLDNMIEGAQVISFDWKYIYVNDAVVKQSKYSREELLGSTMMEMYPGIEQSKLFRKIESCMTNRVGYFFENEFEYPDQSKGYFQLSIQPVEEGVFILSMDISERKKSEIAAAEYTRQLEEMMFMMSHKLRQPVAHILGLSQLLENSFHSPDELKKIVQLMKEASSSLDDYAKELSGYIHQSREVHNQS